MMTTERGVTIFAADQDTGTIIGATGEIPVGTPLATLGLYLPEDMGEGALYSREMVLDGQKNYCMMEVTDGILVGVSATYKKLYENVPGNMMLIIFSLCVLSFVTVFLILKMLDTFILMIFTGR